MSVHGTKPQFLFSAPLRRRIYASPFWQDHASGVRNIEALVDEALLLKCFGGTYGGTNKPSNFLCLIFKMLLLNPDKLLILEFINNKDFKYIRLLGAFYLRLTGQPLEIYCHLEPLYEDFRKVRMMNQWGSVENTNVDEFVDQLLLRDVVLDVTLPHLPKRSHLQNQGLLEPRRSQLLLDTLLELDSSEKEHQNSRPPRKRSRIENDQQDDSSSPESHTQTSTSSSSEPERRSRSRSRGPSSNS